MKFIILFLLCAGVTTSYGQLFGPKKKVPLQVSVITRHPDPIILKGESALKEYYFFVTNEGFFFTDNALDANEIIAHLPAKHVDGHAVELEGTSVDPFVKFKKEQLAEVSRRAGKKINKWDVFVISGHALLSNYVKKQ
jgi:hypothetical protein